MSEIKAFDLAPQWPGGVTLEGAKVTYVSREEVERAQQERARQMGTTDTIPRTVRLDAGFMGATALNEMEAIGLHHREIVTNRFENAPQHVQDNIERTLDALEKHKTNIELFEDQKAAAKKNGDTKELASLGRRQKHALMMVTAVTEELRIAYIAGLGATAFDQQNDQGRRKKFRTDIEMIGSLIEVTIGQSKPTKQLLDYMEAAKKSGRKLYLHGKYLDAAAIKRAERYGFTVGRTYEDMFDFITGPKP